MPPEGYNDYAKGWWNGLHFYHMNYPDGSGVETRTKEYVQRELEAALEVEDYERACILRDEIKAMDLY